MLDLCCFSFISALQILQIDQYPRANAGAEVQAIFGIVTPDAPITALLASGLGLKVGFIGNNVGEDSAGRYLVDLLAVHKITSSVSTQHGRVTPTTLVVCDLQGNRTWFSYVPRVLESLLTMDLERVKQAKLVYVDLYAIIREASRKIVHVAMQNQISLFLNLGGDQLHQEDISLLRRASVAVLQTSLDFSSLQEAERHAQELHHLIGPDVTIVTLAEKGLVYVIGSSVFHIPAYTFDTIHSNGAGAAFSAGFAYASLQGWELIKSLNFASALGGMYCTVQDGFGRFFPENILEEMRRQALM